MDYYFKNFSYSLVATAPSPASSGTSLVVSSGTGSLFPAVPFIATVWPVGQIPSASNAEIIKVTNVSSDTLTIVRQQESSNARTILVGDQIAATITTGVIDDLRNLPYGSFSDSSSQGIANVNNAYAIALNTDEAKNYITHSTTVNNSRVYIDKAGTYLITFSAIGKSAAVNKLLDIWLSVDGTNVPRSNTRSRFVGTANERIITVTFIYSFTANQYFELYMASDDTGTQIVSTGTQSNPTRPACPSIIVTVNWISKWGIIRWQEQID